MPRPTAFADPVLARCDRGAVRRCRCCAKIGLQFNGVALAMTRDELRAMRSTLDAVREAAERPGAVWGWALRAETAGQRVAFELWGDDADVLADLLAHAEAVLDLDRLLLNTLGARPES